jgi:hypothetical protein
VDFIFEGEHVGHGLVLHFGIFQDNHLLATDLSPSAFNLEQNILHFFSLSRRLKKYLLMLFQKY